MLKESSRQTGTGIGIGIFLWNLLDFVWGIPGRVQDFKDWRTYLTAVIPDPSRWIPGLVGLGIIIWAQWPSIRTRVSKAQSPPVQPHNALPSAQAIQDAFGNAIKRGLEEGKTKVADRALHVSERAPLESQPRITVIQPPERLRDGQHPLVNKSPGDLMSKLRGMTSATASKIAQEYVDKWTALDAVISNVDIDAEGVTLTLEHDVTVSGAIFARFNKRNGAHYTHLEPGDRARFCGRIESLERFCIWYRDCEPIND
jgi:hypothetical protein